MLEQIDLSKGYKLFLMDKDKSELGVYAIYSNKKQVAQLVVNNDTVIACCGPNDKAPDRKHIPFIQEAICKKKFDIDSNVPYICLIKQDGNYYNVFSLPKSFIVEGNINISGLGLCSLPDLSTVIVRGNFDCSNNDLRDLKGTPKNIGGDFICAHNRRLKTLKDGPMYVYGNYDCSNSALCTLQGAPGIVGGGFNCSGNMLRTLVHGPMSCGVNSNLNKNIDVNCSDNPLESLCGLPSIRKDMHWLLSNTKLSEESTFPQWLVGCLDQVKGISKNILSYWGFYGSGGSKSYVTTSSQKKALASHHIEGVLPEGYIKKLQFQLGR